jgi:hypothetical protein
MPTDGLSIRGWLKMLGLLTAGAMSLDEAEIRMTALARALATEFEDWAFSEASVIAVAGECKHFPTFGEIVALLREWCRDHRPRLTAIAAPPAREAVGYVLPMPPPEKQPRRPLRELSDAEDFDPKEAEKQDKAARESQRAQLAALRASEKVDA